MTVQYIPQASEPTSEMFHGDPNLPPRILVVDDDAFIRRLNTDILTRSGYRVDAADDGAAAWNALQLKDYDLMVTDNDMPKLTGVELIQKVQAARMALPVIMATRSPPEFSLHGLWQPVVTLLKPYTFHELLAVVKEVLDEAAAALEEIAPPSNWQLQPLADRFPR